MGCLAFLLKFYPEFPKPKLTDLTGFPYLIFKNKHTQYSFNELPEKKNTNKSSDLKQYLKGQDQSCRKMGSLESHLPKNSKELQSELFQSGILVRDPEQTNDTKNE